MSLIEVDKILSTANSGKRAPPRGFYVPPKTQSDCMDDNPTESDAQHSARTTASSSEHGVLADSLDTDGLSRIPNAGGAFLCAHGVLFLHRSNVVGCQMLKPDLLRTDRWRMRIEGAGTSG